jgi:hypothetical protein
MLPIIVEFLHELSKVFEENIIVNHSPKGLLFQVSGLRRRQATTHVNEPVVVVPIDNSHLSCDLGMLTWT